MRQIMITGFLGADAEVKQTKQGMPYITFRVGNSEYSDAQNETHWYRVTSFNNRYVNMSKYLKKGTNVIIYGDYKDELYQNNEGRCMISRDITANYITFNGNNNSNGNNGNNQRQNNGYQPSAAPMNEPTVDGVRMPSMGTAPTNQVPTQTVVQQAPQTTAKNEEDDLPF